MRVSSLFTTALCLCALSPLAANAASVTFNFDSSNYTVGQYFFNGQTLTPDATNTPPAFNARVGIVGANNSSQAFQLNPGVFFNNNGLSLASTEGPNDIFRLTFVSAANASILRPITSLTFHFTVQSGDISPAGPPATDPASLRVSGGSLVGNNFVSTRSQSSGGGAYDPNIGGYSGNLVLTNPLAFTTVQFQLFNNITQDTFTLDDIVADDTPDVPEPGAVALGLALGLPALWRLSKARRSRLKQQSN